MFKKRFIYFIVFFVIFVISMDNVYSKELKNVSNTKSYNDYYFFIEPFDSTYYNATINYGLFVVPKLGHINDKLELVQMRKSSNNTNGDDIDTYLKYYKKSYSRRNAVFIPIDGNKYCLAYSLESRKNNVYNTYYTRGCWSRDGVNWENYYIKGKNGCYYLHSDTEKKNCIKEKANNTPKTNKSYLELACSSVNRFTSSGAKIEKISTSEYSVVFKITRAPLSIITSGEPKNYSEVKIGSIFNPSSNNTSCPNMDEHYVNPTSDNKMYSPVLGKYSYNVVNYSCKEENEKISSSCNASESINQSCSYITIEAENGSNISSRAEFSINQSGTISNVLSPNVIYQGGGISIGLIYYNTVEWKYVNGTLLKSNTVSDDNAKESLFSAIKKKIKNGNELQNDISVTLNIIPELKETKNINNNLIKKCNQVVSGNFNSGVINTVCTIFLPVTNIKPYSGEVLGVSAVYGNGINNKMYTSLNYTGKLNVSAGVNNLNILKNSSNWSININPNNNDSSCQVDVYSRLYAENTNNNKYNSYKFIYRPINLKNPFPGRVAGANWYQWYNNPLNKARLEESYSKLQYRVSLNPIKISEIKKYNKNKSYLDWDNFENGISSFINSDFKDYYDVRGQNIVGDSS